MMTLACRCVQSGFSREYLEKVVADEQALAAGAKGGVEYEYNTEVPPSRPVTAMQ